MTDTMKCERWREAHAAHYARNVQMEDAAKALGIADLVEPCGSAMSNLLLWADWGWDLAKFDEHVRQMAARLDRAPDEVISVQSWGGPDLKADWTIENGLGDGVSLRIVVQAWSARGCKLVGKSVPEQRPDIHPECKGALSDLEVRLESKYPGAPDVQFVGTPDEPQEPAQEPAIETAADDAPEPAKPASGTEDYGC